MFFRAILQPPPKSSPPIESVTTTIRVGVVFYFTLRFSTLLFPSSFTSFHILLSTDETPIFHGFPGIHHHHHVKTHSSCVCALKPAPTQTHTHIKQQSVGGNFCSKTTTFDADCDRTLSTTKALRKHYKTERRG